MKPDIAGGMNIQHRLHRWQASGQILWVDKSFFCILIFCYLFIVRKCTKMADG